MITGIVNAFHEATIRLPVLSASGQTEEIGILLDTGFSGSLTLPPSLISALALPFRSRGSAILADGSQVQFDIYAATVVWDGLPRNILVETADTDPLDGMSMLYGYEIRIQAVDGGLVTIERL
jgi:clan AA aspartic protease